MSKSTAFIVESLLMFAGLLFAASIVSRWAVRTPPGLARSRSEKAFVSISGTVTVVICIAASMGMFWLRSWLTQFLVLAALVSLTVHYGGATVIDLVGLHRLKHPVLPEEGSTVR